MPGSSLRRLTAAIALAAVCLAPAAASIHATDVLPGTPSDDFYLLDPVPPGPSGDLLRSQELFAPAGLRQWAILYRSTGLDGEPIAVSGLVVAPAAPVTGPRPILALAHGTTGLNDTCAPSRSTTGRVELIFAGFPAAEDGWVVVATDYAGLGTPGPHPYLDGPSEGRAVLHGILAAQRLPEAGAGETAGLQGISQGGHATLWAAELAATEAPGVRILGAVAAAPAADLRIAADWARSPAAGPDTWLNGLAFTSAWSEIYGVPIEQLLTPEAVALVPRLATECRVEPEAQPLRLDLEITPAWAALLEQNTAGHAPASAPILYLQGTADPQIPLDSARALVDRLCTIGSVVDYRELDGVDHAGSLYGDDRLERSLAWLTDRRTGAPATDSCPTA